MNEEIKKIYDALPVNQQSVVNTWRQTLTVQSLHGFAIAQGITDPSQDLVYLGTQYGKGWR